MQGNAGSGQVRRLVVLWIVASFGGLANAGPVKPPPGWTADAKAAVSLSQQLGAVPHFGGLQSIVTTEVYRPAVGGSLFVTRIAANVKAEDRNRAATSELGEIDSGMIRAGGSARPESGQSMEVPEAKQLIASRTWVDASTGVKTSARIIVAANDQQLVAVMGECVFSGDASGEVVAPCKTALDSLDPEIAPATRVPLMIDTATSVANSKRSAPDGTAGPSLIDSGERPSLPPMQIPQEQREPDRRPIYVGLGLIVLAAIFYWNRKNREKLEREYEKRTADKPESPPPPEPARDDRDADDLHAAAADDGTKEDSKS